MGVLETLPLLNTMVHMRRGYRSQNQVVVSIVVRKARYQAHSKDQLIRLLPIQYQISWDLTIASCLLPMALGGHSSRSAVAPVVPPWPACIPATAQSTVHPRVSLEISSVAWTSLGSVHFRLFSDLHDYHGHTKSVSLAKHPDKQRQPTIGSIWERGG